MVYIVVNKEIIPKQMRTSKYAELIEKAKVLTEKDALKVQETEGVSLLAVMSLMRKAGYKVTLRTENKVKYLYIAKAEPKQKK